MKKLFFLVPAILLVAAACSKQAVDNTGKNSAPTSAATTGGQNIPAANPAFQSPPLPKLPVFSGVLQTSDDPAKGNLMLVAQPDPRSANELSTSTKMYIKTQRNYTPLIGKKVLVDFIGTKDSFNLASIVEDNGQANNGPFTK